VPNEVKLTGGALDESLRLAIERLAETTATSPADGGGRPSRTYQLTPADVRARAAGLPLL
jgi:hypothetical protein